MIELSHIDKKFGDHTVLNDVTVGFAEGSVTAVAGERPQRLKERLLRGVLRILHVAEDAVAEREERFLVYRKQPRERLAAGQALERIRAAGLSPDPELARVALSRVGEHAAAREALAEVQERGVGAPGDQPDEEVRGGRRSCEGEDHDHVEHADR